MRSYRRHSSGRLRVVVTPTRPLLAVRTRRLPGQLTAASGTQVQRYSRHAYSRRRKSAARSVARVRATRSKNKTRSRSPASGTRRGSCAIVRAVPVPLACPIVASSPRFFLRRIFFCGRLRSGRRHGRQASAPLFRQDEGAVSRCRRFERCSSPPSRNLPGDHPAVRSVFGFRTSVYGKSGSSRTFATGE